MRVCLVSENVSRVMSGEALLAYQYVTALDRQGVCLEVVCHERVRPELEATWDKSMLPRVHFVEESQLQRFVWCSTRWLPYRVRDLLVNQLLHLLTQVRARTMVKRLIAEKKVDIVFQPAPIAPKGVSCLYDLGVPVVIGPMCGGLSLPPAFASMDSRISRSMVYLGRLAAEVLNRAFPGKLRADALIVADACTQDALPSGYRGKVYRVVESGVDLFPIQHLTADRVENAKPRFLYIGRLVDWKGILFLIQAFHKVAKHTDAVLEVVGDGEIMHKVRAAVQDSGLEGRVNLHGWIKRSSLTDFSKNCDCMVVPSLRECGGNAILETMALGIPVIATAWAGPKSYVDPSCGILVEPSSIEAFVEGLADAMIKMVQFPELRRQMGDAARLRVRERYFDWDSKTRKIVEILRETAGLGPVETPVDSGRTTQETVLKLSQPSLLPHPIIS